MIDQQSMNPTPEPVGHVMAHGDHPTWCTQCGTFDVNCFSQGKMTECRPVEEHERWWNDPVIQTRTPTVITVKL